MTGRESGKGAVGLIIFLAVIGMGIFFLVKYIPPRIDANTFRDEMSRLNNDPDYRMRRMGPEQAQDILLKKAAELNLPIEREQIKITKNGEIFRINVVFKVPVDLKVTTIYQKYDFTEPKGYINTQE